MSDLKLLIKAINFAAEKHKAQFRNTGEPYINHPIRVMRRISEVLEAEEPEEEDFVFSTLIGAVLHDTVEDTDCTLNEIEREFGAHIRHIVNDVSDDKGKGKVERKRLQIEHAADVFEREKEAKYIKLSDKLDNLTCHLNQEKI